MEMRKNNGLINFRSRSYIPSIIFCILLIVILSTGLFSQKFKEVEVDICSGTFKEYLPFDTHFLIKGTVNNDITEIMAYYLEKEKKDIGHTQMSPFDEDGNIKPKWHKIERSWKRTSESDKSFYILIPPLEAKRYYQFYFQFYRPLSQDELNLLKNRLTNSFDQVLQQKANSEEFSLKDIQLLHKQLIEALPKLEEHTAIRVKEGSVFDKKIAGEENFKEKINTLAGLLDPQIERDLIITEFKDFENDSIKCLSQFKGNKILLALHAVIQLNQTEYQYLYKKNNLAIQLANIPSYKTGDIARGEKTFEQKESTRHTGETISPVKLDNIWHAEECDVRIRNLEELTTSLGEIHSLVNTVLTDFSFFNQKHPDIKNKKDLEQLIKEIQNCRDIMDGQLYRLIRLKTQLNLREKKILELTEYLTLLAQTEAFAVGDSGGEFKTRASWYLSPDIGLAYTPKLKEFFPYFGINIYFRPVNREVPLSLRDSLGRRFALLVGVTTKSIEVEDVRTNLFGSKALIVGAGIRLTDILRLTGGGLIYYKLNGDSEDTQKKITSSYFVALSLDWDIKTTIGMLGDALLGK